MQRSTKLTFEELLIANVERLPHFKNCHGDPAHSLPDGSDWSPNDWMTAVAGEVGEAANLLKKFRRGDMSWDNEEHVEDLAGELADVQCYLSLLAFRCGIDLAEATIRKWNAISERIGYDKRL